jgi:hypothetical protein
MRESETMHHTCLRPGNLSNFLSLFPFVMAPTLAVALAAWLAKPNKTNKYMQELIEDEINIFK